MPRRFSDVMNSQNKKNTRTHVQCVWTYVDTRWHFFGLMSRQSFSNTCLFGNSKYDLNLNPLCYLKRVLKRFSFTLRLVKYRKKTKNMTKDSNPAADSVDSNIFYAVVHQPARFKTCINLNFFKYCYIAKNLCLYPPTSCFMTHRWRGVTSNCDKKAHSDLNYVWT